MCGRTCLTLSPDEICLACGKNGKKLEWREEYNLGRKYEGHLNAKGYNTSPQDITPMLISSHHFMEEADCTKTPFVPVVVPALWGIIPKYHKGDYRKHGLTTNNCRLEGLQTSKIYKPLISAGNRCVVLCEGFYEWQTVTGAKSSERKVYYIYFPQTKGIKMEDKSTWEHVSKLNLFKIAGLFDIWYDEHGDSIYNYTIITFESDDTLKWLHHRTPAVLETEQQVEDWLNYSKVPEKEALLLLKAPKNLVWHQVSNFVNNSRNKSDTCNNPLSGNKTPKSKMMSMWLQKGETSKSELFKVEDKKRPLDDDEVEKQDIKKVKPEASSSESPEKK